MAHNLASRHHLRIAPPTSPIHLQKISRTNIAQGDVRRRRQYYQSRRIKGFIRFLPARARRYLTFPSPHRQAQFACHKLLKVYPCFSFIFPQITEQNLHKLPNKIATNYRFCKINLRISKKKSTFAA